MLLVLPAVASAEGREIAEGEVYMYLWDYSRSMRVCDARWFARQLLPSATVTLRSSNGQREVLQAPEYVDMMRRRCRPFRQVEWDKSTLNVATSGRGASGQWDVKWGKPAEEGSRGASTLVISERVELVRQGSDIRIAGIDRRFHELVRGAEAQFWAQTDQTGLVEIVERMYEGIFDRIRRWREERQQQRSP